MTITIGAWIIPAIITLICVVAMFRPYEMSGDYDFGAIFRVVWLFPVMMAWIIYLAIVVWLK